MVYLLAFPGFGFDHGDDNEQSERSCLLRLWSTFVDDAYSQDFTGLCVYLAVIPGLAYLVHQCVNRTPDPGTNKTVACYGPLLKSRTLLDKLSACLALANQAANHMLADLIASLLTFDGLWGEPVYGEQYIYRVQDVRYLPSPVQSSIMQYGQLRPNLCIGYVPAQDSRLRTMSSSVLLGSNPCCGNKVLFPFLAGYVKLTEGTHVKTEKQAQRVFHTNTQTLFYTAFHMRRAVTYCDSTPMSVFVWPYGSRSHKSAR